ncbi:cytochrome P450 [Paludisphaera sp.]|uniref:cytochrome P450 n=1 Tax=Paludisphaera sp. TaxID=2017432 RepID=UPI00301CC413
MSFLDQYDAIPADREAERKGFALRLIRTDRDAFFEELRATRPIFAIPGITLVTRYRDVIEVLSRPEVFSTRLYARAMDPVVQGEYMLARDETSTNWIDKSVMRAMLVPADLPRVRAMAGYIADQALDGHAASGRIEVVSELGRHVPIRVCGDYFGFPGPDRETMYRWSRATQLDMFKNLLGDPAIHEASVKAGAEMRAYLSDLLARKKQGATRGDAEADIFDRLLGARLPEAAEFDDARIIANMAGLLIGAGETTSQAIVQATEQILKRPEVHRDALEAIRDGKEDRFGAIVWEALRFNPINPLLFRLCVGDAPVAAGTERATKIPAGTIVFACTASAMFDEAAFPEPDRFDADRPSDLYLHFGYGHHLCLGNLIGGEIIPEVIKRIITRPGIRLLPGEEGRVDAPGGLFPERFVLAYGDDGAKASV